MQQKGIIITSSIFLTAWSNNNWIGFKKWRFNVTKEFIGRVPVLTGNKYTRIISLPITCHSTLVVCCCILNHYYSQNIHLRYFHPKASLRNRSKEWLCDLFHLCSRYCWHNNQSRNTFPFQWTSSDMQMAIRNSFDCLFLHHDLLYNKPISCFCNT